MAADVESSTNFDADAPRVAGFFIVGTSLGSIEIVPVRTIFEQSSQRLARGKPARSCELPGN
jgi:hypothetical protein